MGGDSLTVWNGNTAIGKTQGDGSLSFAAGANLYLEVAGGTSGVTFYLTVSES